jgi:hypothetical protein
MNRWICGWLLAACAAWVPSQLALAQAAQGHGFAKKRSQDFPLFATVAFMQSYLLN